MSHTQCGHQHVAACRKKKWLKCFQTPHGAISVKTILCTLVIIIRAQLLAGLKSTCISRQDEGSANSRLDSRLCSAPSLTALKTVTVPCKGVTRFNVVMLFSEMSALYEPLIISCPRPSSSNHQGLAPVPHHVLLRSSCPTIHILTRAATFLPSNTPGCLLDDCLTPATMCDWLAVPLCPVPAVYSGICTAPPRTGGRHVNIPARPRLSMTMWVNWTSPRRAVYKEVRTNICWHAHRRSCASPRVLALIC